MLYRYVGKSPIAAANVYWYSRAAGWMIQTGDTFDAPPKPATQFVRGGRQDDWAEIPDPRDRPVPSEPAELRGECDHLSEWLAAGHLGWSAVPAAIPSVSANRVVKDRLGQLIGAAVELGMTEPPDVERLNEMKAKVALNQLRAFVAALAREPGIESSYAPAESLDADLLPFREEKRASGELMTAVKCWERFGISNSVLSREAARDPSIRRKNPDGGSSYVYRYDAIRDLSDRRSRGE